MIDLITSYVFNGSITSMNNYFEWLPFYGYGYYVFALGIISLMFIQTKYSFFSRCFNYLFISSITSLPFLYVLYHIYLPTPEIIYKWWVVIQFLNFAVIGFVSSMLIIGKYNSKEEYMKHIKEKHPDIYNKYFGDKEDEH